MPNMPTVSVIVPTLGLKARAPLIYRALDSILSQEHVHAKPIIVANGQQRDTALIQTLKKLPGVRVIEIEKRSLPNALRVGREAVDSDWFSALDDDDVYLPKSLAARVQALQSRTDFDTVVTNGFVCEEGNRKLHMQNMSYVEQNPLAVLARRNWLLPGAWLCRTDRVGSWLFDSMPKALECTFLAIQFSLRCRLCVLDTPTVVWHIDTPGSESKSRDYVFNVITALEQLTELPLPITIRENLRVRTAGAQHQIADMLLKERDIRGAWEWHLRSIKSRKGLRYLPFSLHLVRTSIWS